MTNEPKHEHLTSAPDGAGKAVDVEWQIRFNDLRREVLEGRVKLVDWWLTATAIFLTLVGIVAVVVGYIGFKTFREIEREARQNMVLSKQHAEEARSLVNEIKGKREEAESIVAGLNAEAVGKDPEKASEAAKSVRENPTASPIHQAMAVAVLLQQQGKIEESLEKWRSIANVAQGTDKELEARAWFSVGYLYGKTPDFKAAIDAYDKAIRLKPSYVEAYNNRGVAKSGLGQHKAAIEDYNSALRLKPDLTETYNNRGNAKNGLGRHKVAIEDYNAALRLKPDYAEAYNNRGNAKSNLGQHAAAIKDYDAALRLKPDLARAYNNRGIAKDNLGRHKAAIEDYDAALRLKPDLAEAYNNRGVANTRLGRKDEARRDLQKALDLARKTGSEDLVTEVEQRLQNLE